MAQPLATPEEALGVALTQLKKQDERIKQLETLVEKAKAGEGGNGAASSTYSPFEVRRRYSDDMVNSLIEEHIETRGMDLGMDTGLDGHGHPRDTEFANYRARMRPTGNPRDRRGLSLIRMAKAQCAQKLDIAPTAEKYLADKYKSDERAMAALRFKQGDPRGEEFLAKRRTLQAGDVSLGGGFIPDDFWGEMIPLLRDTAVVRAAGAQVVPIPRGNLTLPKQTGAGTAYWEAESVDIPQSNQSTGQIQLQAKRLTALTAMSRDLILSSAIAIDQFVRNDLLYQMALAEDFAFLFGDQSSTTPILGLYNMPNVTILVVGTNGAVPDGDIPGKAIQLAEQNFSRFIQPAWLMNSRTKLGFRNARSTTNQYYFRDEMTRDRTLEGWNFFRSEQIHNTFTTGTSNNCSVMFFVDMSSAIIGEQEGILVEASTDASYLSGNSLVSSFTRGEVVIKVERRLDFTHVQQPTVVIVQGLLPL